ncbi:CPBP family intramembrane glutamic endopeptidase, partial [Staphylococcus epidermidis]
VMCASFIISNVYDKLIELLPKYLQYSETQNELELNELFKSGIFIPFAFVLIVIVGPIVEELVFRHLLIGELGKKFNFIVMGVISALSFTYIHVSDAKSPFEFGAYLILAIALVYVYLKSNRNLASSISLHMLNNFISFIWTIIVVFSK